MAKTLVRSFHIIVALAILISQVGIIRVVALDYVFAVNSTVDEVDANPGDSVCETTTSGECTLRAAIEEANTLDIGDSATIELQSGETYILTKYNSNLQFLPPVTGDIVINGNNATIQPEPLSEGFLEGRIFYVNSNGILILNDLTIRSGRLSQACFIECEGAGGYNNGTLTVNNSTFSENSTFGNGAGIYNGGTLTINNSIISNNTSDSAGGGIFNAGILTVEGGTVSGNTASGGGGIFSNSGTLTVTNSTITENSTTDSDGGGLLTGGTVTLTNTTISNNNANGDGGGVFNGGTLNVTGSTILGNTALGSGGIANAGPGILTITFGRISGNTASLEHGGGIKNFGTVTVSASIFSNNSAVNAGGAVYSAGSLTMDGNVFYDNVASNGGGTFNDAPGVMTITNSTFFNNSANNGGGVGNTGTSTVTNSTFSSNTAIIDIGFGGAVDNSNGSLTLQNTIVTDSVNGNCNIQGVEIPITDGGGNMSSDDTCPFSGSSVNNTDPLLGPLDNNGGTTLTHALLGGSPAIDIGLASFCPATDQRGVTRPQGAGCDIGAFEAENNIFMVTNTNESGPGSLRQAILDANATASFAGKVDEVHFNISGTGVQTIQPSSPLPNITEPVVIDGITQPGALCAAWPPTLMIEIDGSNVNPGVDTAGLTISVGGSGSTIRGLVINRFGSNGFPYDNGITLFGSDSNIIECNFLGTSADGLTDLGNGDAGLAIFNGSDNNLVGGANANQRNLISGNDGYGLDVANTSLNNMIRNNYIGVNASGVVALGNGSNGVTLNSNSTATIIGNVVSANGGSGIATDNAAQATILGNFIGTGPAATGSLPNSTNGITLNTAGNIIGGASVGEGNTIAKSTLNGILIQGALATGNMVRRNNIFNNSGLGIDLGNDAVTANDPGDPDSGPNNLQNFPILISALIAANGDLVITYSLDSLTTSSTYPVTIELFEADDSPNGQGNIFLGATTRIAPGSSSFNLGNAATLGVRATDFIVATATDDDGNTSEFSPVVSAVDSSVFIVTKTADTDDGTCDADCSLREAITAANNNPNGIGPDKIHFNILGTGVHTIQPTSPLPNITDPVIIDGYTQPGSIANTLAVGNNAVLQIELDGSIAGNSNGLRLMTENSTVRGLVINRFSDGVAALIYVGGPGNNVVEGNFLGVDSSGTAAFPAANQSTYVISIDSTSNRIGTNGDGLNDAGERNVVSGSLTAGILISSTNNVVAGNYIGTNAAGTAALNLGSPIASRGVMSNDDGNRIGTNADGLSDDLERNIISGNKGIGVFLTSSNNVVAGNYIGTDASGAVALPNLNEGVQLGSGAQNNTIGGTANGAGNLISGNGQNGIEIANSGTTGNQVLGNYIGTNVDGTAAISNGTNGVRIIGGAAGNTVGDTDHDLGMCNQACNLIAGNVASGVIITGINTTGNILQGNYIGTNVSGSDAIPNSNAGVAIANEASGNLVGGTAAGAGNLIAGNLDRGIHINNTAATNNTIQGNYIGTDASGTSDIPNSSAGVEVNAPNNIIGGTSAGAGNLISGNLNTGVRISGPNATGNIVQGNRIGTDVTGTTPLPNTDSGVAISNAANNTIGGTTLEARNIISGNENYGLDISGGGTSSNLIQGNIIGANATGTATVANNQGVGVLIRNQASANLIGGTTPTAGNLIAYNTVNGVVVVNPGTTDNAILGNKMLENGVLGIDLNNNGVTPNDLDDPDTGPNNLQNFPVIATALVNASEQLVITYNVDSLPINSAYPLMVEFFRAADGQGEIFLGSDSLAAPGSDMVNLGNSAALGISGNDQIVATATDASGNTSEFSAAIAVTFETTVFTVTKTADTNDGACDADCSLREAIGAANASTNGLSPDRIHFNIAGTGLHTIQPTSDLPGISEAVVIDGYTQPGASWNTLAVGNNAVLLIELDGSLTTGMGLVLTAPNSTVRGLVINRFTGGANGLIYIFYAPAADNTVIEGNFLGTDATGTTVFPAQAPLYGVIAYSTNNRIGTNGDGVNDAGERNLISGHATAGIVIGNLSTHGNNTVAGNYIGTNAAGTAALSVSVLARGVWANGGNGQRIGTDANGVSDTLERNVISGNPLVGVLLDGASNQNVVAGNYIGTDASGTFALGNGQGVGVASSNNLIGGTSAGAGNLISGNNLNGVLFEGTTATTNTLQGNYIGTNVNGTDAIPNINGIVIQSGPSNNTIGGMVPTARNIISGNTQYGLHILNADNNRVEGNYVGTDASGMIAIANGQGTFNDSGIGIFIDDASGNTIGGATTGAGNLISGNSHTGLGLGNGTTNTLILGNFIGTNLAGTGPLGNGSYGIYVDRAANNFIGGTAPGAGNLISGNGSNGVIIQGSAASNNIVQGNSIFANNGLGIDLNNDGVTPNDLLDPDTGANGLQNIPVIHQAIPSAGEIFIQGQINSAAQSTFMIDFYINDSCNLSNHGEGQDYLTSLSVTTDSFGNGPFSKPIPTTIPDGQFITATATDASGNTSEFSQCAIVGPDNTSWLDALDITTSFIDDTATRSQSLTKEGEVRWYKFRIDPGDQLVVTLTNLPANYDLTVYKDVGAAYNALMEPESTDDLLLLNAEFADSAFSPDRFTPDRFTPDRFTPDAYSADAFSPDRFTSDVFSPDRFTTDVFSPDRFTQDAFAPDRFTPDRFTPDRFTPDRFTPDRFTPDRFTPDRFTPDPEAFTNAQLRALVAVSAFNGTASEGIAVNTWTNDGFYYVRVVGRNGAFSASQPFTVTVQRTPGQCGSVDPSSLPATSLTPLPGSFETLILADYRRMNLTTTEQTALQNKLNELKNDVTVKGVVVDVGTDNRVAAANRLADDNLPCAYAKNLVAESIKSIITRYRNSDSNLKYLVLIGNDGVIPFFRQADQSLLAPESIYRPPVRDSSASQASLRNSLVLTQDAYGAQVSVSYDSQSLPIPNLPVGRLVENQAEIIGMIDAYLETDGLAIVPSSSLVTGYDFLTDTANAVKTELDRGISTVGDKLIARADISPFETSLTNPEPDARPEDMPWNATQLSNALFGSRHDIIFLAGHFSANSALAADYDTRILTQDLVSSSVNLKNAIVFSAGCHSGYNLVNGDGVIINGGSNELDWAQAFARKQATLIAGTGYQYGDTDFIEYSERLYLEFARQLRTGTESVSIGEALVAAKQQYLAGTPQMRGIHAKAYLEVALFGLPMLKVDMPGERLIATPTSIVTSTTPFILHPDDAGDQLGLQFVDKTVDTPTIANTKTMTNALNDSDTRLATYYSSENGVLTNPSEPVLPLKIIDVTHPDDLVLRGVGFLEGKFTDEHNILLLTGAPATELRGVHALFTSETFYPVRPWSLNYYDAIADNGSTFLYITPAQYKSDSADSVEGTLRVFNKMKFRLFYSDNIKPAGAEEGEGESAGAPPPAITRVLAISEGNTINFNVTVVGDPVAGVQTVWITYIDLENLEEGWRSLEDDLIQDPNESSIWHGSLATTGTARIRYIVQAVSGTGLVTLSTNMGAYYQADVDPGAPPPAPSPDAPPAPVPTLSLISPPAVGIYGGTATVTAQLTLDGIPINGAIVNLSLGYQTVQLTSGIDGGGPGQVSHTFPLNLTPGEYMIRATFTGNMSFAPVEDKTALFTLHKQPTSLTLTSTIDGKNASFIGTLVDGEGDPLGQQTVVFVLTRTDGYAALLSAFTKPWGDAIPDLTSLPGGHYRVTAYFGQHVPGTLIDLTSELYGPSSATGEFDVGLVFLPGIPPSDSFNQPNGQLSSQWQYKNPGSYRVVNNQLTTLSGEALYWVATMYGANQGVYLVFAKVDTNSSQQALLLKVQGTNQPDWQLGAIAIVYDAKQHVIRVETYQPNKSQKWTTYTNIALTLHDGDRLGAMALANGEIRIFVNDNQIATTTLTLTDQSFFNSRGGYVGLWFKAANTAALDDFGGGTIVP